MLNYFDVLPIHPQPEYLESLTSYLMRLAELNGISSMDGLSALCFPHQDRRITREIADFHPVSFDKLTVIGVTTEEILQTTTFFHLAAKFGRSTSPQPMSRFLAGSIGEYLRYCPMCFSEQPQAYALLSWRFLMLTGCYKHQCVGCVWFGFCNKLIPLFASPFKIGSCPKCKKSLNKCAALSISVEAMVDVVCFYEDILFLLTPQPWEASSTNVMTHIGRKLARLRQTKLLTAMEAARQIGVTLTAVEGMERGDFQGRGATFKSYIEYTRYLGVSFQEIFNYVVTTLGQAPQTVVPPCPVCQNHSYVIRYGYNRSSSQRYQCQYCHHSFTALPKTRKAKRLLP